MALPCVVCSMLFLPRWIGVHHHLTSDSGGPSAGIRGNRVSVQRPASHRYLYLYLLMPPSAQISGMTVMFCVFVLCFVHCVHTVRFACVLARGRQWLSMPVVCWRVILEACSSERTVYRPQSSREPCCALSHSRVAVSRFCYIRGCRPVMWWYLQLYFECQSHKMDFRGLSLYTRYQTAHMNILSKALFVW